MKNTLQILPWVIILLLLAYISQCTSKGKKVPDIIYKDSIQIRDSISAPIKIVGKTVYYPSPYEVIKYDTLTQVTTTNEHLSYLDWLSLKKWALSVNDSNANITVYLDLQYNAIKKWTYTGELYEKWKIKEVTKYQVPALKNKFYIGCILTADRNKYFGASPSIMFITKKQTAFTLGYDLINKNISTGVLIKLGK